MWLLVSVLTPLAGLLILHNVAAQTTGDERDETGTSPWVWTFTYIPLLWSPPKITMAPKSMKVMEEGTVSFFCKASGNPAPSFHWERKGRRLNNRRNRYEIIDTVPHMSVLRIKPVRSKRENDITFTCVANNGLGEARADATLHVYKKENGEEIPTGYPRILLHPKLKSVEKGLSTVMQCESSGDPEPEIMWLKDSIPIDLTDPRLQLMDNGYLQIQNSQESDEATYECVAENTAGVAYSYPAMMYVKVRRVPPRFSVEPEDLKVMPGSDVNLTCVAIGSPMPFVKWRQGARDLTNEDKIPIGKNVLELKDVKESKNYTCEASSDLGNIERTVQVIVEGHCC